MKLANKMYEITVTIQILFFILFMLFNYDTLADLPVVIPVGEETYTVTINFYVVSGLILAIYGVIILASFTFVETGLNEEGTRTVGKAATFTVVWIFLTMGTSIFLADIAEGYNLVLNILFTTSHILKVAVGMDTISD